MTFIRKSEIVEMKNALRIAISTLGVYAGLLGMEHGYFETLQGNAAPGGLVINAIGTPCQADLVWHACFPALTVIPNMLATGILAIIAGLSVLIWSIVFIQRERGGLILLLLSLLLFAVGGGFVSTFIGAIAGIAGSRINVSTIRRKLPANWLRFLAKLWPWTLISMIAWFLGSWIMGHFFGQAMLSMSTFLFFFFDVGLPLLTVFSGFAYDFREI